MSAIYRGTSPTFKLTPRGYTVSELGTPSVVIAQDMVFISLDDEVTVDAVNNCVVATLPIEECLRLVPGLPASVQLLFDDGTNAVAFAPNDFDVLESLVETVLPPQEDEPDEEEEEEEEE